MKKAEYAAENFISEDSRKSFLEAMESIAKLASAGKADNNGNMDYGVGKGTYLGHGSNLVTVSYTHLPQHAGETHSGYPESRGFAGDMLRWQLQE